MFKSIRTELFLIIILLVMLPIITSNIFSYYITSQGIETKMHEDSLIFTLSVANNISSVIGKSYAVVEELSFNKDITSFDPAAQEIVLKKSVARNPQFDLLYVQKTDGYQTANSLGVPTSNRSGRWWFKKFMTEKSAFVSKSYYTTTDNTAVTSIFMPVYTENGLVGILGADLKLNALQRLVEELSLGKGSYTYILDGQGTVIAHPDKIQVSELYNYKALTRTVFFTNENGQPIQDKNHNHFLYKDPIEVPTKLCEVTELALSGEKGTAEYTGLDGKNMICAYSPVRLPGISQNWAVITVENKTAAMATATTIIEKNLFVAAFSLLITIIVTYIISRRITRPIMLMNEHTKKITQGQLQEPLIGDFGDNEVGHLAQSFDTMRCALAELHTERENMFLSTIRALVIALESKDGYTHFHSVEVAEIAAQVASELGLSQQEQFRIKFAALLHDIGKIGIPDHVLNKQGSLTEEEWLTMQRHPVIGAKIIGTMPGMEDIATIIKHHHSRWDGKGYPSNLANCNIPLGSRIIAIADTFQAMTSDRPYRKALSTQQAMDEIQRCAGNQFDSDIVSVFMKIAGNTTFRKAQVS